MSHGPGPVEPLAPESESTLSDAADPDPTDPDPADPESDTLSSGQ